MPLPKKTFRYSGYIQFYWRGSAGRNFFLLEVIIAPPLSEYNIFSEY
jgi:hypothetical protein